MPTHLFRAAGQRERFAFKMLALLCASGLAAAGDENRLSTPHQPSNAALRPQVTPMKIQITLDGAVIATATLDSNETAREFAALMPLNLFLKDYAATEKIADLPRKLSIKGAPNAYTPTACDISYYAPWGNLAIFYKDGHLSSGLVRIGRMDSGLDAIRRLGPVSVRVDRAMP